MCTFCLVPFVTRRTHPKIQGERSSRHINSTLAFCVTNVGCNSYFQIEHNILPRYAASTLKKADIYALTDMIRYMFGLLSLFGFLTATE